MTDYLSIDEQLKGLIFQYKTHDPDLIKHIESHIDFTSTESSIASVENLRYSVENGKINQMEYMKLLFNITLLKYDDEFSNKISDELMKKIHKELTKNLPANQQAGPTAVELSLSVPKDGLKITQNDIDNYSSMYS